MVLRSRTSSTPGFAPKLVSVAVVFVCFLGLTFSGSAQDGGSFEDTLPDPDEFDGLELSDSTPFDNGNNPCTIPKPEKYWSGAVNGILAKYDAGDRDLIACVVGFKNGIAPTHILHVDEHHDMLNERKQANLANFMFHAMCLWPACRVHWLVQYPIDSPAMWLEDETWESLRKRFSYGPHVPRRWPEPDLVSVSTSPEFIHADLAKELLDVVRRFLPPKKKLKKAEAQALDHSNHDHPKPKRQSREANPGQSR